MYTINKLIIRACIDKIFCILHKYTGILIYILCIYIYIQIVFGIDRQLNNVPIEREAWTRIENTRAVPK